MKEYEDYLYEDSDDWLLQESTKSDAQALKSNIKILMLHLLKYEVEYWKQNNSWLRSINYSQNTIIEFASSRSVMNKVNTPDEMEKIYQQAVKEAVAETGLNRKEFPANIPNYFTIENFTNKQFIMNFLVQKAYTDEIKRLLGL